MEVCGFASVSAVQSYVKMTTLQTDRLTLRPLAADDAEAYAAVRGHPEVAKWLSPLAGDPIGRFAEGWRERGYAPWGIFLDGRLIGHGGLNFVPKFAETEVLWALHPDAWGKGYATESAAAIMARQAPEFDLRRIIGLVEAENAGSVRVLKKLGLTFERRLAHAAHGELDLYALALPTARAA